MIEAKILLRLEVEAFLIEEAWLLDNWQLEGWLALFTEDARSYVPALDDPHGAPSDTVYLVSDDMPKMRSRVEQLLGRSAWVESPRSKTRRLIGNVRIEESSAERIVATASFVATRSRRDHVDTWMGYTRYRLVREGDALRITERTVYLAQDSVRPQNMISIIL